LPLIVAVSGHRDLRPEDVPALEAAVRGILTHFQATYPTTKLVLFSPLAAGADRLVARVALGMGIGFRVPLPMPEHEYKKDFTTAELAEFDALLGRAEATFVLPYHPGNDATNLGDPVRRARQYAALGAYVARIANVFIALWNGLETQSVGGTGQIVTYRLRGAPEEYRNPTALLDATDYGPVYHVMTPRVSDPPRDVVAGTVQLLGRDRVPLASDPAAPIYRGIEAFNSDPVRATIERGNGAATRTVRDVAEHLASWYKTKFYRWLDRMFGLAAFGALVLAFAHGTAMTDIYWVPIYAGSILVAYVTYRFVRAGRWQDRFLEYRALEIGLTVQQTWDGAGIDANASDYYLRLQRTELDWIRAALQTVHVLDAPIAADADPGPCVRSFVVGQFDYFSSVARRDTEAAERAERLAGAALWLVIIGTVMLGGVCLYELFPRNPLVVVLTVGIIAGIVHHSELVIHAILAATIVGAVSHEYPRQCAFHAQARRYEIMRDIYGRALAILDDVADRDPRERMRVAREVALEIGREALAENGDWVMLHRELPIEMLHL
jgi:hypothetical protein